MSYPAEALNFSIASLPSPDLTLVKDLSSPSSLFDRRIEFSPDGTQAFKDGSLLALSPKCLRLLNIFAQSPDTIIDKADLSGRLWGYADSSSLTALGVSISVLRQSLGSENLGDPKKGVIRTAHGLGWLGLSSQDPSRVGNAVEGEKVRTVADGRLEVNFSKLLVRREGEWLGSLPLQELMCLNLLVKNSPNVVPIYDAFAVLFPGRDHYGQSVREHLATLIRNLRTQLGKDDLGHPTKGAIRAYRNLGYKIL